MTTLDECIEQAKKIPNQYMHLESISKHNIIGLGNYRWVARSNEICFKIN